MVEKNLMQMRNNKAVLLFADNISIKIFVTYKKIYFLIISLNIIIIICYVRAFPIRNYVIYVHVLTDIPKKKNEQFGQLFRDYLANLMGNLWFCGSCCCCCYCICSIRIRLIIIIWRYRKMWPFL